MISYRKKLIPIYEIIFTYILNKKLDFPKDKKNAFIFLAPDYGNIGDLAIENAQIKFISANLKDYNIIPVTVADTYKYLKSIRQGLKSEDAIFLIGGGNFGDLYPKTDFGRIFVVKFFSEHMICSFPQTMLFTNTKYGKKRLEITKKAFNKNTHLVLFAREKISYDLMKKEFNNQVYLSPDIVLSLLPIYQAKAQQKRTSVTFTMRSDGEKLVSQKDEDDLVRFIQAKYNDVVFKDTGIEEKDFQASRKDFYLEDILDVYSKSKVVLTDRLHGMIFAAITGTPCIVLPNTNHKIKETYNNWLSSANYITFLEEVDIKELERLMENYTSENFSSNYLSMHVDFSDLTNYLKNI